MRYLLAWVAGDRKDLGVHTEMFSDGVLPLVEKGVITGAYKKNHAGKIVTSFVIGSQKLYDFVDDNPMVQFLDTEYVNDMRSIQRNPQAMSINSAIQVDLTGQVSADSVWGPKSTRVLVVRLTSFVVRLYLKAGVV